MLGEVARRHFENPHNMRKLEGVDIVGQAGEPGEGPFMTISLRMDGDTVAEAAFETYGCPSSIACGSWVTAWITGRPLSMAEALDADSLMKVLGGLPLGKEHCAALAVRALRDAARRKDV